MTADRDQSAVQQQHEEEEVVEQPYERADLHALVTDVGEIRDRIDGLKARLNRALSGAVGDADPDTDEEIRPANGDRSETFETAEKHLDGIAVAVWNVQETLAAEQGFRDFEESGALPG